MSESEINKIESPINFLLKIISELLNDKELNNVKKQLLDFLENYLENKPQNDLSY